MKIISLNAWGGRRFEPLMEFVRREVPTTDVFCFQEVFTNDAGLIEADGTRLNLFDELGKVCVDFVADFAATTRGKSLKGKVDQAVFGGQAMFVRKTLEPSFSKQFVLRSFDDVIAGENGEDDWPVLLQSAAIRSIKGPVFVAHIHGIAFPGNKRDTPERLAQSQKIARFIEAAKWPIILCGDLNLMPDTQSIARIEAAGMRNLIAEFHIERTRPQSHFLAYPPEKRQLFADYAFVSTGVVVRNFAVPPVEASDHLPLVLELE